MHVTAVTTFLLPRLTAPTTPLPVLTALPTALYLDAPEGVVAIVTSPHVLPPLGLALSQPDLDLRHALCDTTVTLGNGHVCIPGLPPSALAPQTERWCPSLAAHLPPQIDLDALRALLPAVTTLTPPPDPALQPVLGRATALFEALRRGDAEAVLERAATLVGLGPGLTPAGDDLLIGLCAALTLLGHALPARQSWLLTLRQQLGRLAPQTTTLSASWLTHAAAGNLQRLLIHTAQALALADAPALAQATRHLMRYGATSGWAMLAGLSQSLAALLT